MTAPVRDAHTVPPEIGSLVYRLSATPEECAMALEALADSLRELCQRLQQQQDQLGRCSVLMLPAANSASNPS